jgi:hypothetical protein
MSDFERIGNKELAWDMAYAQKPFIDIAETARVVGKKWMASSILKMGEIAASKVQFISESDERWRRRAERDIALAELAEEYEGRIITWSDFRSEDPENGQVNWDKILEVAKNCDDIPIVVVEYHQDSFALVGDFREATKLIGDEEEGLMLERCVDYLEATLEFHRHGLDENLPHNI